jgi:hypothetical protein
MGPVSASNIIGDLRSATCAEAFYEVVKRVHHRYATELVASYGLCPFLKDPETAFGEFVVVLSRELDLELAASRVLEAQTQVVHLVYPLVEAGPTEFERFGNQVHQRVAARGRGGPVHAAFHPEMAGDASTAAKLVGVVRRAPDPFIQFIPEGLHDGGSTFVDLDNVDLAELVKTMPHQTAAKNNAKSNFERLTSEDIGRIQDILKDIRADRDRSYAEFLDILAGD